MREPVLDIVRPIRCCVLGRRAPIVSRDEMRRHAYIVVALACWLSLSGFPAPDYVPDQPKEQKQLKEPRKLGQEWEYVSSTDTADYFINLQTIRSSGQFVRVWGLDNWTGDYKNKRNLSSKWLDEYDCVNEQRRTISSTDYGDQNGTGDVVDSYSNFSAAWHAITPDSIGSTVWKFTCRIHELHAIDPSQWTKVTGNDERALYAALSTHRREGRLVRLTVLLDEPDQLLIRSEKMVYEFHCGRKEIGSTNRFMFYSDPFGRGTLLGVGDMTKPDETMWRTPKNRLEEALLKFACQPPKK